MPEAPRDPLGDLRSLTPWYYVLAIATYVLALAAGLQCVLGLLWLAMPELLFDPPSDPTGAGLLAAWIMLVVGLVAAMSGVVFGTVFLSGASHLRRLENYWYCVVIAGIACAFVPLGTPVGLATLWVLRRPEVRAGFVSSAAPIVDVGVAP